MKEVLPTGKLYLIPTLLGETAPSQVLPAGTIEIIQSLNYFIVEQIRTSRRFLSKLKIAKPIQQIHFEVLNKHTSPNEIRSFLNPVFSGSSIGLMSEAGTPCIADPGASIVEIAHLSGVQVIPLTGPNSILLALMASGLNGQSFAFNGYLPINQAERSKSIKSFELASARYNQTQLFIETPFRNKQLFEALIKNCQPSTKLCIATNISLSDESILTKSISEWHNINPDFNKKPSVFLILAMQ